MSLLAGTSSLIIKPDWNQLRYKRSTIPWTFLLQQLSPVFLSFLPESNSARLSQNLNIERNADNSLPYTRCRGCRCEVHISQPQKLPSRWIYRISISCFNRCTNLRFRYTSEWNHLHLYGLSGLAVCMRPSLRKSIPRFRRTCFNLYSDFLHVWITS